MNEKIGVIVPVYKTEKYVAECIESILAQTFTNFRLILVDDGSPDDAGAICDEYAKKDKRITVIHQKNAGVTRARARGVEEASDCEWIAFVDSDDMILAPYLEALHSKASDDTDIVLCTNFCTETAKDYNWLATVNLNFINNHVEKSNLVNDAQALDISIPKLSIILFRKLMAMQFGSMPWGRLFRRNTMNDWAFCLPKDIYWGEDAIMNLRIAFNTKKDIVILKQALYFYRQASDGVCNNFKANPLYEEELRKHCYDSIPQKDFNDYKEAYLYRRVFLWRTKFNNSIHPEWANTPFYDTLIKEIKAYDFHLDLFDRLLINHTHPIIRCLILFIRKTASTINRLVLINKHI